MSAYTDEFKFELSTPLEYQCSSGLKKTEQLLLLEPVDSHEAVVSELQQGLTKAILSMQKFSPPSAKKEEAEDDEDGSKPSLDPDAIIMSIQSSDVNYYDYKKTFYKLLCSGVCVIEDGVKLTQSLLDSISLKDKERLLGEYIANFMLPSWTNR